MLLCPMRPLSALRAFIHASPICAASAYSNEPSCFAGGLVRSQCPSPYLHQRDSVAHFSASNTQPKSVPYALMAAARAFEEQVAREELDFLPHAYDYLRRIVSDVQCRGFSFSDTDTPILTERLVKCAMSLLAISPQREHAVLHLAMFDDLHPILHLHAEIAHPLEFTARTFQNHVLSGALDQLPHIYDHLHYLADATPNSHVIFPADPAASRAVFWMRRLMGGRATHLLPRILHDFPRLFGSQPTLMHHQLVIKGFLARDMSSEAWNWLRKMEQCEEGVEHSSFWQKPSAEEYDLFLKYFSNRGDVLSARMLLAQMRMYTTPSRLSYYHLIAAIINKHAPAHDVHTQMSAVVEEMEREGHGVHLRTLSGIMKQGSLQSCVTREVFDVLRAAQERSNARARGDKNVPHEQDLEEPERVQSYELEDNGFEVYTPTKSSQNTPKLSIWKPRKAPLDNAPVPVISEMVDTVEAPNIYHPDPARTDTPYDLKNAAPLPDITHEEEKHILDVAAESNVTPEESTLLRTAEHTEDGGRHSLSSHISVVPVEDTAASIHASTVSPAIENDPPIKREGVSTDACEALSRFFVDDILSEQRRPRGIVESPHIRSTIPIDGQSQPLHDRVSDECVRLLAFDAFEQKYDLGPTVRTASISKTESPLDPQPARSPLPVSVDTVESMAEGDSEEPNIAEPLIDYSEERVRRRYKHRLIRALRHGDLRIASKIYANLTALVGPDMKSGRLLIKDLCKGHLFRPPPRPHILQALRIYQSLFEMEKGTGVVTGFFDGANREISRHMTLSKDIYGALLGALTEPGPTRPSSQDYGTDVYEEYTTFATGLLEDMRARNIKPDHEMLISVLLLRFRAAKTHKEAFDHYKSLLENSRSSESVQSSDKRKKRSSSPLPIFKFAGYKAILNAFTRISFPDAPVAPPHLWFSIVDDMRSIGYPVTVKDYTKYLARIADNQTAPLAPVLYPNGDDSRIRSIYGCIQHVHKKLVLDANISPDTTLLNALMNTYQRLGAFVDALQVFNTIWLSGRMDHVSSVIIFDACGHAGQQNIAHTIWCMLVAKGWRFDKRELDTWVECLCRINVEAACRFVCVYMGRENAGYLSKGDTRPDVQTCLILLKLSWLQGQNADVKERIKTYLPHIWSKLETRYL